MCWPGLLERLLPGPLPVGDGLLREARLGVVMGQQLGSGLSGLGKLCLKHLGNALVMLLTGTPQQRLITNGVSHLQTRKPY